MDDKLKLALRRLGYRPMVEGTWAKPVGHHLFTLRMVFRVLTFTNFFKGRAGSVLVWETKEINHQGREEWEIKNAESFTRHDTGAFTHAESDFGFLTAEEAAGLL